MKIPDIYRLNFHAPELDVLEVLDFQSFPVLTVEVNKSGFKHLSFLVEFTPEGCEKRIVIPVTESRLDALKSGEMSVKELFDNAELGQVYCLLFDEKSGAIVETYLLPLDFFKTINPISSAYKITTVSLS